MRERVKSPPTMLLCLHTPFSLYSNPKGLRHYTDMIATDVVGDVECKGLEDVERTGTVVKGVSCHPVDWGRKENLRKGRWGCSPM